MLLSCCNKNTSASGFLAYSKHTKTLCYRSCSIQESVFLGDAQPLQLEWTCEKGGDDISSFIVVLSSDCAIRYFICIFRMK